MITYNHERYIQQAIESVLNQKGNFLIQLIIGVDKCEDQTESICLKYKNQNPDNIILLTAKERLGAVKNYYRTLLECKGDYLAILEGDDYWSDNYKIQK